MRPPYRTTLLATLLSITCQANASAPISRNGAPTGDVAQFNVGAFQLTAIRSDHGPWPLDRFLHGMAKDELAHAGINAPVDTPATDYLLNTGAKLILIDAGAPALEAGIRAAGYTPEQIDEVYITHLHDDHAAGLSADGKASFPNATVRLDRREAQFWLNPANASKAPAILKGNFARAAASLQPYLQAGRVSLFDGDTPLQPGVRAVANHGHTPGHTLYAIESEGAAVTIWGDLVHNGTIQFANPAVTIVFDTDAATAAAAHADAYRDAAASGAWVAASHQPFPGIGRLLPKAGAYTWQALPANAARVPAGTQPAAPAR